MGRAERSVLIIGLGVLGLVVLAVVAALALGSTEPTRFPEGSPEDVLQRYLIAVEEGRAEEAYDHLSARAREDMSFRDFSRYVATAGQYPSERRVRIDRAVGDGDRVTLYLTVEFFHGSGIDFNRSTYERPVRMVREDGVWKVDEPLTVL
ncbi:hypothetical protein [Sphaerobacter thermophilus]|jgi:hypothetical protein|uniref:Rv0361 family membrane protein n=1 Tax=Sphaerobacter thermophilus TaxID=2057 RepID=UPI0039C23AD6